MSKKLYSALALAITLPILLSSCSDDITDQEFYDDNPAVSTTLLPKEHTPLENYSAVEYDDNSEIPSDDIEIGESSKDFILPKEGQGLYQKVDGTYVLTDKTKPLSEELLQDLQAYAQTAPPLSSIENIDEQNTVALSWQEELSKRYTDASSHQPVIIWSKIASAGADDQNPTQRWFTSMTDDTPDQSRIDPEETEESTIIDFSDTSKEALLSKVQEWANAESVQLGGIIELPY